MKPRLAKWRTGSLAALCGLVLAACAQAYEPPNVPLIASLKSKTFITVSDRQASADAPAGNTSADGAAATASDSTLSFGTQGFGGPALGVPDVPDDNAAISAEQTGILAPRGGPPLPNLAQQATLSPWAAASGGYQAPGLGGAPAGLGGAPAAAPGGWSPAGCFSPQGCTPPRVSEWYTRADYFHLTARWHSFNLTDESGPLYNLGYTRQWGDMRLRLELFGGDVTYHGWALDNNNKPVARDNTRGVMYGGRAEYDFYFCCGKHPWIQPFWGLGLRCWSHDVSNAVSGVYNISGFHETWFTFYPYIGFETRRDPTRAWEFYGRTRIGVLAWNWDYNIVDGGGIMFYPRPGVTALLEEGVRVGNFTVGSWAEVFGWCRSGSHDDYLIPATAFVTIGVKAGWIY